MSDSPFNSPQSRRRLVLGIILLAIGGTALAVNLGLRIPDDWWWDYGPWALLAIGVTQLAWPGARGARRFGFWLAVVGGWLLTNQYEVLGLTWATSWPIFIIAAGVRVMLGSIFFRRASNSGSSSV